MYTWDNMYSGGFIILGCVINADGKVELRTLSPGYDEEEAVNDASLNQQDPKEKMTYTEQAAKRNHCHRLTRWVGGCTVNMCCYKLWWLLVAFITLYQCMWIGNVHSNM